MPRTAIVIGAGVAGLTAAYRLQERGFDVTVLEREPHVGGKTAASRRDGFILNRGATILGGSYAAMRKLAADVGVADAMTPITPTIGVAIDGGVEWLRGAPPGALIDFARTPLLSRRSKLMLWRLGVDAFRARKKTGYDKAHVRAELDTETLAEYCDRRLNQELLDRLLAPLIGGIYGWSGGPTSVADLYFTLVEVLAGGMLGYRGGMDFFARAIAEHLEVETNADAERVERLPEGARVRWSRSGETRTRDVDGVVITVPAPSVPVLYPGLDPDIQGILLEGLPQANFLSVRVALSRAPERDALLAIVPEGELEGVSTIMFEHLISPGSAPPGKALLGVLFYDNWVTANMDRPDAELIEAALAGVERVAPGITAALEFAEVTRWAPAAVRTERGVHRRIAEIHRRIDPSDPVQLAGDYLAMPSINGSVITGEEAAARLAAAVPG